MCSSDLIKKSIFSSFKINFRVKDPEPSMMGDGRPIFRTGSVVSVQSDEDAINEVADMIPLVFNNVKQLFGRMNCNCTTSANSLKPFRNRGMCIR